MTKDTIDINEVIVKNFIESIRPEDPDMRKQVDIGYSYHKILFELYEIRPDWQNQEVQNKVPFARLKFTKSKKLWTLYWLRGDDTWERYEPLKTSSYIDELLKAIQADKHGCFFG